MPESVQSTLKIFIHAVDGIGHLNACVGLGQALKARGHTIYFLLNESFENQFTKFGFTEILLRAKKDSGADEPKQNMLKVMGQSLKEMGYLSAKTPLEKMRQQMQSSENTFAELIYSTAVAFDSQIAAAIDKFKPDIFLLDNILIPPALQKASIPWAIVLSAQPLCIFSDPRLPPFGGGFPANSDPSTWQEYRDMLIEYFWEKFSKYQSKLDAACDYVPPVALRSKEVPIFYLPSPYLNIYGYPKELDYDDIFEIPENFVQVDAFIREDPDVFTLPEEFAKKPGKLVYVSMGSLGSIDVELMKRLLGVLAKTPHKYIISKGQRADEFELPPNCWGEAYLSQTRILPMVDLVITHGGNNTTTEAFSFGKPMIVLPLFGDQYDNAQRVHEKGYGVRLEPYTFKEEQLIGAIEQLLNDKELHARLKVAAERISKSQSKVKACQRIEEVVAQFRAKQVNGAK